MFVSHVECTVCGHRHDAGDALTVCAACGQVLAVRDDLARVAGSVTKDELRPRPPGMYRFRELLPLAAGEAPVTLGEGGTPLLALARLAAHLSLRQLWAKDEGRTRRARSRRAGSGWPSPVPWSREHLPDTAQDLRNRFIHLTDPERLG